MNTFPHHLSPDYALLDSGDGEKLERFGDKILVRPSSLCVWKRRHPDLWQTADARFQPKQGWRFRTQAVETWKYRVTELLTMILRLQTNGQIGVFPEHDLYLSSVQEFLRTRDRQPRVLNLFAYTGMASLVCAAEGAQVTHVDMAKATIGWTRDNLKASSLPDDKVRFVVEDAISYIGREKRRNSVYDLIIADPPSFSRTSKKDSWDLDQILSSLVADCCGLLDPLGMMVLTSHALESGAEVLGNLVRDNLGDGVGLKTGLLTLKERDTERRLPASAVVMVSR